MGAQVFSLEFAGEGQSYPEDQWPVIDLNPEEWQEIEEPPQ